MTSTPASGEFFEWAIHLTRGQLLDLVLEIEERLRRLVRSVFAEHRKDWEKLIPESIRTDLGQRTGPASPVSTDLLDRADLGQLVSILLARWPHFVELLGDKHTFQVKADEFREWRNYLAHGKNPSQDEKLEIALVVRQVGQKIPVVSETAPPESGQSLQGSVVLWVDDHPEWNLLERQILRTLGIEVVPVLSNDEAVSVANQRSFDLVISDIDHGGGEPGDILPSRLRAVGVDIPFVFYVGSVDPGRDPPAGAASITDSPATLVRDTLMLLS